MKLLMFPGQGSQYPGMARDWVDNFAEARLAFEEASDGADLNLKKLVFEGADADLRQTEITQPAILTASLAVFRALEAHTTLAETLKAKPLFAGHSLGEYSALVAAGVLPLSAAARIVRARGKFMQEAVPAGVGGMLALVFKPKTDGAPLAAALCEEASKASGKTVSVANYNSPEQIVIAGQGPALEAAAKLSAEYRFSVRKVVPLPVSAPFHSPLMKSAADRLQPELERAPWAPSAERRYIANVDAQVHDLGRAAEIVARLSAQIHGSVRWVESIQAALAQGYVEALEIGPGKVLTGLAKRISFEGRTLEARGIDSLEEFKRDGERI